MPHAPSPALLVSLTKTDLLGQLVSAAGEGVWVLDRQGRTLFCDELAQRLGVASGLSDPRTAGNLLERLWSLLGQSAGELELPVEHAPDRWLSVQLRPLVDAHGHAAGSLLLLRDISERKRQSLEISHLQEELSRRTLERTQLQQVVSELTELSLRDALTGLFNRRALGERLVEELSRARRYGAPLSLMMVDIDDFKRVNDTHGHTIGDVVIGHVARLLTRDRRVSDIVARYGGEELVLLLPHTPLDGALTLADRLRQLVAHTPYRTLDAHEHVTVSVGVAAYQHAMHEPEQLLEAADRALYRAKRQGKNRVCGA
jgi:diguanylate cyclase (GGDEF)-like protein